MISKGTYLGKVVGWTLGGLDNGKEHVAIDFEFFELEGVPRMTWYGYLHTEKIFPMTMKALREIGFKGNDISDLSSINDAQASLVVEVEEYEGKARSKIKWVNSPDGRPSLAPMDPVAAKNFAATLRGKIAAFDQSAAAPKVNGNPSAKVTKSKGPRSPEPPPIADDLPF